MVSMRSFGNRIVRQFYKAGYRVLPRLFRPRARGPLVLLYHNVEDAYDVWTNKLRVNVTPRRFEDHVRFLTENFRVVPFSRICRADAAPDEIAITFDDGYASTLNTVLPILEKYHCPIKVYLTTENLTELNWLNKLCYLLNALSSVDRAALAEAALGVAPGQRICRRDFIDNFDPERTAPAIDDFFRRAYRGHVRRLFLTVEEARQLAAHPLVEIGSHTRHHYPLTRLGETQLHDEVVENHRQLNRLLDNKVQGFAIPFGYPTHRTPEIVRAIGEVDAFVLSAYGGRLDLQNCHGLPEVKRICIGGNLGSLWHYLNHPN